MYVCHKVFVVAMHFIVFAIWYILFFYGCSLSSLWWGRLWSFVGFRVRFRGLDILHVFFSFSFLVFLVHGIYFSNLYQILNILGNSWRLLNVHLWILLVFVELNVACEAEHRKGILLFKKCEPCLWDFFFNEVVETCFVHSRLQRSFAIFVKFAEFVYNQGWTTGAQGGCWGYLAKSNSFCYVCSLYYFNLWLLLFQ